MEKSIETIWKEGFLESDALIAPKLNDLYNQKSKLIVDKFKRMFKINLIGLVAFSVIVLVASFIIGIPYMGVPMFLLFNVLVIVNTKLMKGLGEIDTNVSSYQYLKAFDNWMKKQISVNTRMARYYYPFIFLSVFMGFWFADADGIPAGEMLVYQIILRFPDIYLVNGIPLIGIVGLIFVVGLLAFFGGALYRWDLNIVYGRVLKKLEEMLADMEELRS